MQRELFLQFRERRALGRPVRLGWFLRPSKDLFAKLYPERDPKEFCCSNGWFRNLLTWHQISLRSVMNIAGKLPRDFGDSILTWMRYNRRNSQLREGDQQRLSDSEGAVGSYRLQNIRNMDQRLFHLSIWRGRHTMLLGRKLFGFSQRDLAGTRGKEQFNLPYSLMVFLESHLLFFLEGKESGHQS